MHHSKYPEDEMFVQPNPSLRDVAYRPAISRSVQSEIGDGGEETVEFEWFSNE